MNRLQRLVGEVEYTRWAHRQLKAELATARRELYQLREERDSVLSYIKSMGATSSSVLDYIDETTQALERCKLAAYLAWKKENGT